MKSQRSIFEYTDYRAFLKDAYTTTKIVNKGFSHRVFARTAGFKASNVLKLVMDGKRNIAPASTGKFAKALGLNKEETAFFHNLVLFNQANSAAEREHYAEKLLTSRSYRKLFPLNRMQYDYFSHWYYVPIREMVGLNGFKEDYDWIAGKIFPPITPQEAKKAIDDLITLGILSRDSTGKLRPTHLAVGLADEFAASSLTKFHREMMKRASECIDRVPRDRRELTALTFSVTHAKAQKIKELISEFRAKLVETITDDAPDADSVYQLNMHWFPLVEMTEEKK